MPARPQRQGHCGSIADESLCWRSIALLPSSLAFRTVHHELPRAPYQANRSGLI
jgi:hypothetical protein